LNRWHLLCVINSSHTFKLTFFKPCTVVIDTLKMCMWVFGSIRTFFEKLHVVELSHFSSMFWINCIYRHQLITFIIMDKCFRATQPFLFLNQFFDFVTVIHLWTWTCLVWIRHTGILLVCNEDAFDIHLYPSAILIPLKFKIFLINVICCHCFVWYPSPFNNKSSNTLYFDAILQNPS
jgi:hypothetical protein